MTSENTSRHYALEHLCNGVYAAVARDGGAAIGNAGIVDLGDSTLIVDTFLTPTAAEDLRADAQRLTRRLPHWVVNTHYHNDHIWGNQVFLPQADLISTVETRALIETAGHEEYTDYRAITDNRLNEMLAQRAATKANGQQQPAALELMIGYFSGLARDLPRLQVTVPTVLFEKRMVLHGSRRRVEIMEFRGAHTGSDAVVYLPDDGIVFMSDLLFIGVHPYLGDGNPDRWVDVLRSIAAGSAGIEVASRFVPGHGPAGTVTDLEQVVDYIKQCQHIARALAAEGRTKEEDILSTPVPGDFANWKLARFFQANLRFLLEKYQKAENAQEPAGRAVSRF
jgi:cyclase